MRLIATKGWNLDTVLAYIKEHGADIEEDTFGNIVIYPNLHEDTNGNLREGTRAEPRS